jgi:hypothetical protein
MSIQFTKAEFDNAYNRLRANANQSTLDLNALILGGAQLYFTHKYNTGYIERAMLISRNHSGLRVNAVRSFFQKLTGVAIPTRANGKPLKRGTLEKAPQALMDLDVWTDWAEEHAQEPTYDHKAMVAKIDKYLEAQAKIAKDANDGELVAKLEQALKVVA